MNIFPVGDRTKNNKLCVSCLLSLSQKLGLGLLRLKGEPPHSISENIHKSVMKSLKIHNYTKAVS